MDKKKRLEIDLDNIAIDKGVKKPLHRAGGRIDKWFLVFAKLAINDSFAIPYDNEIDQIKIRNAIQVSSRNYRLKHDENFKGTVRILFNKQEVRFWRDK